VILLVQDLDVRIVNAVTRLGEVDALTLLPPFRFTAAFPRRTEPFARGLLRKELMKLSHQVRIV